MNICKATATITRLLLTLVLLAAPLSAQRRRPAEPKPQPSAQPAQAAPTFDTLLAADSYKIYGEVKGVGQLLRSAGVNDILDPVMKLAAPPKEFKTLVRWLNSHADALMTSRLMFAAWPSRPKLPQALFVIEFPSAEEAQKFEPKLNEFLPKFLPTPNPESSPSPSPGKKDYAEAKPNSPPQPPPYILKQSGTLVFISDTPFTFKNLRPANSRLLTEDQKFLQVRDRLNSDSLFLYFDVASAEKEEQERMLRMQEEEKKLQEIASPVKADDESNLAENEMPAEIMPEEAPPPPAPVPSGSAEVTLGTSQTQSQTNPPVIAVKGHLGLDRIATAFTFGKPSWPKAIGVAIAVDADSYVLRALLVNSPEVKGSPIPFIPQLVSGPALTPEASSILPADTELLVTLSLDYLQMYEGMVKAVTRQSAIMRGTSGQPVKANQPESPFVAYETKMGLKVKEDLLPLLGHEVALSLSVKTLGVRGPHASPASTPEPVGDEAAAQKTPPQSRAEPVIAISVRDKEAVRTLLPRMIEALGFKGASMLAQTEKRDDTELVSYANAISYAFIGNFLIVSSDTKAVRHVVDSYLNHQTLASDSSFKNYTRWQPQQVLGQVYVSPALMETYNGFSKDVNSLTNDALRDFLSRLSPMTAEPVTYALSNEGQGPLHELHVPKNLLLLMIAGIATASIQPPLARNEAIAQSTLRMIVTAESTYQATTGDGNYGTLDQLVEQGLVPKDLLQQYGYKIELTIVGSKFEASVVPLEYGKTGKMSFYVDQSAVIRGGDHGGGAATVADKPVP